MDILLIIFLKLKYDPEELEFLDFSNFLTLKIKTEIK